MQNITQIVTTFLNRFNIITMSAQKVFRYLWSIGRKCRNIFPSIDTIALRTGLSRRTVDRALALLKQNGWLCSLRRGYTSCEYFIQDEILALDIKNKQIFSREMAYQCRDSGVIAVLASHDNEKKERIHEDAASSSEEKIEIPKIIQISGLSLWQQRNLAKKFSVDRLVIAIEDAKAFAERGNTFTNFYGFVYNSALNAYNPKTWMKK